jgi:nucleotide-binding universal stress UspA family protein
MLNMYRDLLVHVDGGPDGRARLRFAVELAERLNARLSGLHVTPPAEVPPMYKASQLAVVIDKIADDLALDARQAAAIFSEETTQCSITPSWSQSAGDVAAGISEKARFADLVILGQYEQQDSPERHPLPAAHSVVLNCGRPVLVVPANARPGELRRIAIAWDGSREAVRAVHDALPLLRMAQSVQIITVVPQSENGGDSNDNRLSAHLRRHGVKVGDDVIQIRTDEEHGSLQNTIEQDRYDLLVMGGYSHSMWIEFIFGGATQSILLSSTIPVLVSH